MKANSTDEVLSQLRQIILDTQRKGDRTINFASLYYKMTAGVKVAHGLLLNS